MQPHTSEYFALRIELWRIAQREKDNGRCFKLIFQQLKHYIDFDLLDLYISTYEDKHLVQNYALMCIQKQRDAEFQLSNYRKFSRYDFTITQAFANSGKILSSNPFINAPIFLDGLLYLKHCVPFGLHSVAGMAIRLEDIPNAYLFIYFTAINTEEYSQNPN